MLQMATNQINSHQILFGVFGLLKVQFDPRRVFELMV